MKREDVDNNLKESTKTPLTNPRRKKCWEVAEEAEKEG